jgi:hypothetical protein
MKTHGGMGIYFHVFLTSALDIEKWSVSCLGCFTSRERAPDVRCIGCWVGTRACLNVTSKTEMFSPAEPGWSSPLHSQYIDWTIGIASSKVGIWTLIADGPYTHKHNCEDNPPAWELLLFSSVLSLFERKGERYMLFLLISGQSSRQSLHVVNKRPKINWCKINRLSTVIFRSASSIVTVLKCILSFRNNVQ